MKMTRGLNIFTKYTEGEHNEISFITEPMTNSELNDKIKNLTTIVSEIKVLD